MKTPRITLKPPVVPLGPTEAHYPVISKAPVNELALAELPALA